MTQFDHLTTDALRAHIARLQHAVRQPSGMAHTLEDIGLEHRELNALTDELTRREAPVTCAGAPGGWSLAERAS